MKTMLITNSPELARDAEAAGVARFMVDLESMGKKERQASRTTFISSHQKDDISKVKAAISKAELIVRINPWHAGSALEIDQAVAGGAQFIMLPMIEQLTQLEAFMTTLAGRAKPLPLIETAYSMQKIDIIAAHPSIPEVYIGLNDLHLSLGQRFLFEPLADGSVDTMAAALTKHGKPFGFGGIAAIGSGELPAERVLGEHARMGSSRVILSSRFGKDLDLENPDGRADRLKTALDLFYKTFESLKQRTPEQIESDRLTTNGIIGQIAARLS